MANQPRQDNGLTARQNQFIECFIRNGGKKTEAAKEAGYSEQTARVRGYELANDKRIQKIVHERSNALVKSLVPMALNVVKDLAVNGKSDSVRLAAAQDILNRSGMRAIAEHQPDQSLTTKQQYNAILGEIRKALENHNKTIDITPQIDTIETQE